MKELGRGISQETDPPQAGRQQTEFPGLQRKLSFVMRDLEPPADNPEDL